jgi:hypothetical protein
MTNLENECVHFFSDIFIRKGSTILRSLYQKIQECKAFLTSWEKVQALETVYVLTNTTGSEVGR